jgi:hypothetical protein
MAHETKKTREAVAVEIATDEERSAWAEAHAHWTVRTEPRWGSLTYEQEVEYIDQAKAYDAWQANPTELPYPDPPGPEPQLVDFVDAARVEAEIARHLKSQA